MLPLLAVIILVSAGCTSPKIRLFPSQADPLKEFTLEGKADQKILVIPVRGIISDAPREGLIRTRPSLLQGVVSQLRLAEDDKRKFLRIICEECTRLSRLLDDLLEVQRLESGRDNAI